MNLIAALICYQSLSARFAKTLAIGAKCLASMTQWSPLLHKRGHGKAQTVLAALSPQSACLVRHGTSDCLPTAEAELAMEQVSFGPRTDVARCGDSHLDEWPKAKLEQW